MKFVKRILWMFVRLFFSVYFSIFGRPIIPSKLKKALSMYEDNEFFELFSLIRAWDAPFKEVNSAVPKSGVIYDLGCGDGTQTNFLALSSSKRKMTGIELNRMRVNQAHKGIKNATFKQGSILDMKYAKADGFVLTHVLHHLPTKSDQVKVLQNIKSSLKKDGKVVIVEIIRKPLLKYIFTWLTDAFIVPILFEQQLYDFNFHYRTEDEWDTQFQKLGFVYSKTFPHKGKPFSHVIYVLTNENK